MKTSFLALILVLSLAEIAYSQPQNTAVSDPPIPLFDGEPYLAVNPTNPENMVIAWMSYIKNAGIPLTEQIGIHVKSSFDGGKSWGNEITMPHYSPKFHSADVSMAFHGATLYIEYIDYKQNPDSGGIVVTHSTDGGKSWSTPIKAFDLYDNGDRPIDRPWIAIDNSGTASDGTIYITTKPAPWDPIPNRPYMKFSTDGGNSWSKIDTVDGGDYLAGPIDQPMVSPAVTSDGVFRAAYISWNIAKNPNPRYTVASSNDKGKTYTRTTITIPKTSTGKDTLSKLGYHLAVNPSDAKNMIFVWPDSRDGDLDVYAVYTTDGGISWSADQRINDDPKNNGVWQDLVWANYSDDGKCVISWRDRRNGDSTGYQQGSDIYFAVSTDGGKTFGKNMRVSDKTAPFNIVLNGSGNDFQSTAIVDDSLCVTWGDVRTGKLAIYFAKAAISDGIAKVVNVSNETKSPISIFPNPASNKITIELTLNSPEQIELFLYDENGKEAMHQTNAMTQFYRQTLDLSKFSSGVYSVVLTTPNEQFSRKFTVER